VESSGWTGDRAYATGGRYIDHLKNAVQVGTVDEAAIDRALRNALEIRFRLGLFDPIDDQPYWKVPPEVVASPDHVRLAVEATGQGFVLLKNDNGIIPLDPTSDVGLFGPHIFGKGGMVGNYAAEICEGDPTNQCVTSFHDGFSNFTTAHGGKLRSHKGCLLVDNDTSDFEIAIKKASKSDVVVFVGGIGLKLENESEDRPDIRLPAIQVDLIKRLAEVNPNIVLVLMHGGMVGLDDVLGHVAAVVSIGYPGRYAGTVLPEVLFGLNDRAWGKTPITWYRNSIVDELNMLDMSMSRPPGRTYRYYTSSNEPHFRFGTGLHPLTRFEFEKVTARPGECVKADDETLHDFIETDEALSCPCSTVSLTVSVANVGRRDGDEVIMAYFVPLEIPSSEPASKLVEQMFGYERVHIKAGKSVDVTFSVKTESLQLANDYGELMTFSGRYRLLISNGNDQWGEQTIYVSGKGLLNVVKEGELEGAV
jgi:xylan 1,4-beta-xylosidase